MVGVLVALVPVVFLGGLVALVVLLALCVLVALVVVMGFGGAGVVLLVFWTVPFWWSFG